MARFLKVLWHRLTGSERRRISREAALKYAYCRGFCAGQVWKDDPRGNPYTSAEYQWDTCARDYCVGYRGN